jgi:small multidrug resistance pump
MGSLNWLFLAAAILCEVCGTTSMKLSAGFSKIMPSVLIFVFYAASFGFLTMALRSIQLGLAYAIWAGLGTALTVAVGVVIFKEPMGLAKLVSVGLIIAGVVGLKLSHTE